MSLANIQLLILDVDGVMTDGGIIRDDAGQQIKRFHVRDGEVVGRGFHTYADVHHAEVIALARAGEKARGATLYLNLEPCAHHGRTPPCTDAIVAAGVAAVVAPIDDPNPLVGGEGFRRLRAAGVEVEMATDFAAEAAKLNEPFLHFMRTGRPLVTLKTAITLDGKISAPDDNRGWITSERARAHVQEVRHDHDAILTGIGTVLADDCLLNDRTGFARCRPLLRLVMDSQLRLPLDSKMARSAAGDVVVVATSASSAERRKLLEDRGIRVLIFDGPGGRSDLRGDLPTRGAASKTIRRGGTLGLPPACLLPVSPEQLARTHLKGSLGHESYGFSSAKRTGLLLRIGDECVTTVKRNLACTSHTLE